MSSAKKIIAVVGATGKQGGALVRAILKDGEFSAMALARDSQSKAAQVLQNAGANVVQTDVYNADKLARAIEGCHGLYCVTPVDFQKPENEILQAKAMAEAAKKAGIQHVVWSTLEDVRKFVPLSDKSLPTLMGKYKVPHLEVKGESDQFFANLPTTYMLTSFYWDNLFMPGAFIQKMPLLGKLVLSIPIGEAPMPGVAVDDIGTCALGIFRNQLDFVGQRVGLVGESLTGAKMAAKISKATGKQVGFFSMPYAVFRRLPFPGASELSNMFQVYHDYNQIYCANRSLSLSKALNPFIMNFDRFLAKYKDQIPFPVKKVA